MAQGLRKVFRPKPCGRICAWMRNTTPKEESLAEWGCAEVPPTRPCNGGQYRSPTPNASLRKEVEREADDPEGNLVIVEKCACREAIRLPEAEGRALKGPQGAAVGRKRQHHFS